MWHESCIPLIDAVFDWRQEIVAGCNQAVRLNMACILTESMQIVKGLTAVLFWWSVHEQQVACDATMFVISRGSSVGQHDQSHFLSQCSKHK